MDIGEVLQPVLIVVIQTLLPIIMGFVVLFLNGKLREVRLRIDAQKLAVAEEVITRFVLAAEQSGLIGYISGLGKDKKQWVIEMAKYELSTRGITLDLDTMDAMVEGIVFEYLTQVKVFNDPE